MCLAEVTRVAIDLIGKAVVLTARWAAASRRQGLETAAARPECDKDKDIVFLRDRVAELQSQVEILKQLYKPDNTTRYMCRERLMLIFHITYFAVPRRKVHECFGVARSSFYRWLEAIDGRRKAVRQAWNRTAADVAALIWDVVQTNSHYVNPAVM